MTSSRDESAEVRVVATEFLRVRPLLVAPFLGFTLAVLVAIGAPLRQIAALGTFGSLAVGWFFVERARSRRRLVDAAGFERSLVLTVVGVTLATCFTGALASPLLPMLFAPVGVAFAAFGRARRSLSLVGALAAALTTLFVLTGRMQPFAIADEGRRVVLLAAFAAATLLLGAGVGSLAAAHRRAAETLGLAGDEMVRAAQARARALEATSSRVAHEVKNPLAAIRALVEVMLESADERTQKRLSVAAGEIGRIESILEAYASFAQPLDAVRRRPTDVTAIVEGLVAVLGARAERAGISLDALDEGPISFAVDRDRLHEALLNLVVNALDASAKGGAVTVATRIEGGALVVAVRDTGKGMDASTLARIGTPYFTRREQGTGLGVALARQVAAQHGGELRYESEPGKGTLAVLRIPAEA